MPVSFVHLSDIHFGQEKGSQIVIHDDVKRRLVEDAACQAQQHLGGRATGVIVSGDIAYSGKSSEYRQAGAWLDDLTAAIGCEKTAVQVVPGNHDIDLGGLSSGCELMLNEVINKGEYVLDSFLEADIDREAIYNRFSAYRPFAEGYNCPLDRSGGIASDRMYELAPNRKLHIIGLNSALICRKKDVQGQLLLGARQRVLPRRPGEELVVICHHPLHWLQDSDDARRYIRNRARIPLERACRLMAGVIDLASDRSLLPVLRDPLAAGRILDTLLSNLEFAGSQAARVLALSGLPFAKSLQAGQRLLPYLAEPERDTLVRRLLVRSFSEAPIGNREISQLLEHMDGRLASAELIEWATPDAASLPRVAENIVILEAAGPAQRYAVAASVDKLSYRLANRSPANLGQAAYDAWAKLIRSAPNEIVKLKAASPSLTYALLRPHLPVSSLVVASFPSVHAQLLRSKEEQDARALPGFLALPISFFVDLDRARSARRDLTEAYLNSIWPPSDLLFVAMESSITDDILESLTRTTSGRSYIYAIGNDLFRFDEATRYRAQAVLSPFLH